MLMSQASFRPLEQNSKMCRGVGKNSQDLKRIRGGAASTTDESKEIQKKRRPISSRKYSVDTQKTEDCTTGGKNGVPTSWEGIRVHCEEWRREGEGGVLKKKKPDLREEKA